MFSQNPSARRAAGPLLILAAFAAAPLVASLACGAAPAGSAAAPRPPAGTAASALASPPADTPAASPKPGDQERRVEGPELTVRETAGVARRDEVVRSGIPLPRSLAVRDTSRLAVVDAAGRPVPADFRILARWNAGLADANAPVQWLLVAFPATVAAKGSATYRLVSGGPQNPPPARPLTLRREGQEGNSRGGRVVVDTGAAVFTLGGDGSALFERVALPGGEALVTGGSLSAAVGGGTVRHTEVRRLRVEHAGPLTAAVVVDGAYGVEPVGKGGLGSRRRYLFAAGSPTALVTQSVAWEGNLGCQGCITTEEGAPNGLRVERVRDLLRVDVGQGGTGTAGSAGASGISGITATAVAAFGKPAATGSLAAGEEAWVRQRQRARRTAPAAFDVRLAGTTATGGEADGALLAASGPAGTVAVALDHMHRYEPQALRILPGGELAVDLADDHVWLAHHQGLFATLAVSALPGTPKREDLDRQVWAPLNRPLRAWPDTAWFTASEAVDEVPVGRLTGPLAGYDETVSSVLEQTLASVEREGTAGLMTYGLYPRYWGKWGSPELNCKGKGPERPPRQRKGDDARKDRKDKKDKGNDQGNDKGKDQGKDKEEARADPGDGDEGRQGRGNINEPTPGEDWDDIFWCGSWTDYHSTSKTAAVWAMRSGEVQWLDEISVPAARRMLYTQIMQCAPDDPWFYCGQAPAGYGGYRKDFNSSHAYFENLFLYYWLSGDSTVLDVLHRGAEAMRRHMCDLRGSGDGLGVPDGPGGPACPPAHPFSKATFTGRVGSQWLSVFRFVGLASEDASFLEDFRGGLARGVTRQYAELTRDGRRYGFLGDALDEPGRGEAGPLWVVGFYDAENLYRLSRDTGDAPIGEPPVRPSQVLVATARMMTDLATEAQIQEGKRRGWPVKLGFTWSGERIGGILTGTFVPPKTRPLFGPEKAGTAALLMRAARQSGDRALLQAATEVTRTALLSARDERLPLGKLQGQYLTRVHSSAAVLAELEHARASHEKP